MKKLVMIFAAAGFVLASCGGSECLSCTGLPIGGDFGVCESVWMDESSMSWQEYVDGVTETWEASGGTCTVSEE